MKRDYTTALFGVVFLVIAGLLHFQGKALSFRNVGGGISYDPLFFPSLLLGVIALLSVFLIIGSLFSRLPSNTNGYNYPALLLGTLITGFYFLTLKWVGFIPASIIFMIAFMLLLQYRRFTSLLLCAFMIPLVTWLTFTHVLNVPLP